LTWLGNIASLAGRWRVVIGGVLFLLLILLLFPFKMPIVPRWRLRVVDDAGVLVRQIKVTEHWQHYLVESEGHEEVRQTDESGRVDFPERSVRASIVSRIIHRLTGFASQGMKAKTEPYASIVVWGNRDYETVVAVFEPEGQLQSEVLVHRQR
jgi:hypothetical protein